MGWLSSAWHSTTSGISKAAHVVANVTAPITKPVVAGANALAHTAEAAVNKVEAVAVKVEKAGESVADHVLADARAIENTLKQGVVAVGNTAQGIGSAAQGIGQGLGSGAKGLGDSLSSLGSYLPWLIGAAVVGSLAYAANQAGMFKRGKRSA